MRWIPLHGSRSHALDPTAWILLTCVRPSAGVLLFQGRFTVPTAKANVWGHLLMKRDPDPVHTEGERVVVKIGSMSLRDPNLRDPILRDLNLRDPILRDPKCAGI